MKQNRPFKIVVVGDEAHGVDVLGKQSPDGKHKEWQWSREVWADVVQLLKAVGCPVELVVNGDKEPGREERVRRGNAIARKYPNHEPIFISIHNDAQKSDGTWGTARGASVWTSKGFTKADTYAELMLQALFRVVTETRHRTYSPTPLQRDFENDFTVLVGTKQVRPVYHGMLLEIGFQDNREDVAMLASPQFKKKIADAIVDGIELINNLIWEQGK